MWVDVQDVSENGAYTSACTSAAFEHWIKGQLDMHLERFKRRVSSESSDVPIRLGARGKFSTASASKLRIAPPTAPVTSTQHP